MVIDMESSRIEEGDADAVLTGVASLLSVRILHGWEPPPPPSELLVQSFTWGNGIELPAIARKLSIEGPELTVFCEATSDEMFDAFKNGTLRNKSCSGEASQDFSFSAKTTAVSSTDGWTYPFSCKGWILQKKGTLPLAWVARFDKPPRLQGFNLHIQGNDCSSRGLRLDGQYTHYLMQWPRGVGPVWYIIDLNGCSQLDSDIFRKEFHALQFTLGRPLSVDVLYGLDADLNIVAYRGGPFGYGHLPSRASARPPLGYTEDYEWIVALFAALCGVTDPVDEGILCRSIGYYIHSLGNFIESQLLELHIAVESLAHNLWLKESNKEPKLYRARHGEWLEWCKAHEKEIKALALPDEEAAFFDSVRWADRAGTSAIVVKVCERWGWMIDDTMKSALRARNRVAHEGHLLLADGADVDDYVVHMDAPRTMLIALIAKLVGYNGPILGYHSRADTTGPPWWIVAESPPPGTAQQYVIRHS